MRKRVHSCRHLAAFCEELAAADEEHVLGYNYWVRKEGGFAAAGSTRLVAWWGQQRTAAGQSWGLAGVPPPVTNPDHPFCITNPPPRSIAILPLPAGH